MSSLQPNYYTCKCYAVTFISYRCSLPVQCQSTVAVSYSTPYAQRITFSFWFFTHAAEPPKITSHPAEQKDAAPGKLVAFSIQATGTEPLKYHWKHKIGQESGRWQLCDVERFPGANSSTLTIPSVKKSNEGSYCCTVRNCAGSETTECATLTVGELNCMYGV